MQCSNRGSSVDESVDYCPECGATFISAENTSVGGGSIISLLPIRRITPGIALLAVFIFPVRYMTYPTVTYQRVSVPVIGLFVLMWIVTAYGVVSD
jgi:ABC-type Co2+ transport system permease subunit